jgi:hypothetical protein
VRANQKLLSMGLIFTTLSLGALAQSRMEDILRGLRPPAHYPDGYVSSLSPEEHELKLRSQLASEEYVLIGLSEERELLQRELLQRELLLGRLRELSEPPASSGSQKPKLSFELPAPSFSEPPKPEETARLRSRQHWGFLYSREALERRISLLNSSIGAFDLLVEDRKRELGLLKLLCKEPCSDGCVIDKLPLYQ